MERGEAAVLLFQFGALAVVVLLLTLSAPGQNAQSTPNFTQVYWGDPAGGVGLSAGQTNAVSQNASTISAFFDLAYSTKVTGLAASSVCINPQTRAGISKSYTSLQVQYDAARNAYRVTVGPTSQRTGWQCTYTISLTDSIEQTTTWVGTVELK